MSRDERVQRNIKNIERQNQSRISNELKPTNFTNKNIKALAGAFQEIEIGGEINEADLESILQNNIMNEFIKKDPTKHLKVNVIIEYFMIKNKAGGDKMLFYYNSNMEETLLSPTQINQWIAREIESFLANIDEQKLNSDLVF